MFPVKPRENVIPIDNEIEAKFLETVLQDRGIPHVFISHHDTAFNGIYQMEHGWGYVEVPKERVEETKKLYQEVKRSRPESNSESNPEGPQGDGPEDSREDG